MAAYTLSDYQTIPNANTYVLPTPVMDIIARLSQIFGTTFSTTTVYTESKPRIQRQQRPKEEWKTDFKATTIIEKGDKFTDIRTALNKLSPKNYDATSEFILEKVKELVDKAQKVIGVTFTSIAGTTQPNIQIPATAKYMVGFCFAGAGANTDTFDLIINNERCIDNGSTQAYQIATGRPDMAYYNFFRPVAGATAINLDYTSIAGGTVVVFQIIYV